MVNALLPDLKTEYSSSLTLQLALLYQTFPASSMIHLQLRRCVLSASRNIGQQRAMGFKVRVGAVEAPQTPIAERQRVQQTWGISGSETLEKLRVATPGITYVSVASPALFDEVAQAQGSNEQLVAVVRVSSDAQDLLGHVDVLTRGSNRLLIGFDPRPPRGWPVQEPVEASKHLLTEIFVREAELRSLGAFGGGSLVVAGSEHGNVLVTNRPYGKLKLASFRGSQVFVTQDQGFHTGSVSLFAGRGGQILLSAPEIIARNRFRAAAAGRWGQSKIVVQAPKLATPISNEDTCHCDHQSLAIAGSGSIDTSDVTSRYGRVAILGSGSATLQTTESLTVGTLGSSRVNYVEPEPENVRGSTSSLRAAAKTQHDEDRVTIAAAATPPTRESAFDDAGHTLDRWCWKPWSCRSRQMKRNKRWRDDFAY
ncbi:putative auto-transporter adhesin head GIN domain [Phytophthora infestans]|uniref:Putative auto-transporter adhesin head GIN domain n=2 Tax=Phytophthora infestans TaxID=4787 RepID=A0A833RNR2_PHYIN|nr:putative auto-transporter adhesin head GIN domain [Phytophthora infestans]